MKGGNKEVIIIVFKFHYFNVICSIWIVACKTDKPHEQKPPVENLIEYTITFANTNLENVLVEDGKKLMKPSDPSKDGFTFGDWYVDSEFKTLYNFDKEVKENLIIYALFI